MNRNHTLDVLRGALAWTVVLVHVAWVSGIQGETQHQIGVLAVEGFVILSGYVITQLILTKRETYGRFIFRRFMRLAPIFMVCLVFSLAIRPITAGVIPGPYQVILEASERQYFWQHLLAHLTMLHGTIPSQWLPQSQLALLVPAWSISLEFQLYLVAPLLVWWLSRSGLRGMLVVLIPSALCVVPPLYGMISNLWQGAGGFLPEKFLFFLCGSLIYLFTTKGPNQTTLYIYPSWAIHLGEISYSTYLIHYPVLSIVTRFIPRDWSVIKKASFTGMAALPIVLALSLFLYRYIEVPGIKLGKRLIRKSQPLHAALLPESIT
jgi:peptidoglycan/LPS O-acetylase OafA/YrhL